MAYSRQELVELGWSFDDACDYYLDYIDDMYDIVAALVDERNKLRERVAELEALTDEKRYIPQEWYQLATTENTKLHELVRDLVRWCGADHQPHEELQFWGDKNSGVYARVRELGVEVDE